VFKRLGLHVYMKSKEPKPVEKNRQLLSDTIIHLTLAFTFCLNYAIPVIM